MNIGNLLDLNETKRHIKQNTGKQISVCHHVVFNTSIVEVYVNITYRLKYNL